MNWKEYEKQLFEEVESVYPDARVLYDCKLPGRYSQVSRQCDVLVEEEVGKKTFRTLYDAKHHDRKIDVKQVEEFVGLLNDTGCDCGALIAPKGFTKAAYNLAYYGPHNLDLDILSFGDLKLFHGIGAMPYAGDMALFLSMNQALV
ncbi:MAG: restriction endonuclease [Kordiimonadaceae bacterium]|nr:restriction endonuclease [Kordiimonadaceae bacterium]